MITNYQPLPFRSTRWQFYWLCGLMLSFSYERPLAYLTPFDRTNPRLFDLFLITGILFILPRLRHHVSLPKSFKIWGFLVAWFSFCAVLWTGLLDWNYAIFSLFCAAKYVGGLIAIYMAIRIPLNNHRKRTIHGILVVSGVFVAIYCIPEYFSGNSSVLVRQGLEVNLGKGVLVGPFGASYFQLAQTSSLYFAFALTFFLSSRRKIMHYMGPLISIFIAWPLFFSGARTGLALVLISLAVLIIIEKRLRKVFFSLMLFILLLGFVFDASFVSEGLKSGTTIQRLENNQEGAHSIGKRMSQTFNFSWSSYKAGNLLPLIGGGFYVAPVSLGGNNYYYRIDYGIHSIYLFALEQAGILGLILFLWFLFASAKSLLRRIKSRHSIDQKFAKAFIAYFVATLIVGIGGHNFWQGFGSGNYNSLFMICLLISLIPSYELPSKMCKKSLSIKVTAPIKEI